LVKVDPPLDQVEVEHNYHHSVPLREIPDSPHWGQRGFYPVGKLRFFSKKACHFDLNEIAGLIENEITKSPSMCPSGKF